MITLQGKKAIFERNLFKGISKSNVESDMIYLITEKNQGFVTKKQMAKIDKFTELVMKGMA